MKVKYAWSTFFDFQRHHSDDPKFRGFMEKFNSTFCRGNIQTHFLGLFDCVNSVGQFGTFATSKTYTACDLNQRTSSHVQARAVRT